MRKWRILLVITALCVLFCACSAGDAEPYADETHEHVYGYWYEVTALSCCDEGEEVRYCKICHAEQLRTLAVASDIAERVHAYEDTVVPPSGGEAGFLSRSCALCGHTEREPLPEE